MSMGVLIIQTKIQLKLQWGFQRDKKPKKHKLKKKKTVRGPSAIWGMSETELLSVTEKSETLLQ